MQELSLNILDIAQNSIKAGATLVRIEIEIDRAKNGMRIAVIDNGCGMDEATLERVVDPFYTTRTTRKVGLGIPMMQENAEKTGGKLNIRSTEGEGTELTVTLDTKHIDCLPLGDLSGTLLSLILMHPDRPDFHFHGASPQGQCDVDTREIRQAAGNLPLNEPAIAAWLQEAIHEEINPIFGGANL